MCRVIVTFWIAIIVFVLSGIALIIWRDEIFALTLAIGLGVMIVVGIFISKEEPYEP